MAMAVTTRTKKKFNWNYGSNYLICCVIVGLCFLFKVPLLTMMIVAAALLGLLGLWFFGGGDGNGNNEWWRSFCLALFFASLSIGICYKFFNGFDALKFIDKFAIWSAVYGTFLGTFAFVIHRRK